MFLAGQLKAELGTKQEAPNNSSHHTPQSCQAGWIPTGPAPGFTSKFKSGWDQPPQPHEAGGSGWQSADNTEWAWASHWQHGHSSNSEGLPPPVGGVVSSTKSTIESESLTSAQVKSKTH
jgi:hypothetical protein